MPPKRTSKTSSQHKVTKASKSTSSKAPKPTSSSSQTMSTETDEDGKEGAIFFWREYGSEHCYMSQWYHSPFTTDTNEEIVYQNAEQYMMYGKALLFDDPATGALILQSTSPLETKRLGRQVENFNEEVWLANRLRIVEEGTYFKFKNGRVFGGQEDNQKLGEKGELWEKLKATGDRELVEASPRDRIWGVGFGEKNAEKMRERWGLNLLGKALMTIRKRLREEKEEKDGEKGEAEKNEV